VGPLGDACQGRERGGSESMRKTSIKNPRGNSEEIGGVRAEKKG